jgi:two-component system, NtrC family, sensor kinase
VLVVDDDPDVREVIGMLLEDEGYEVVSCADGGRAWEMLHNQPQPDLVILDLMLPRMNGWELRSRQRADAELAKIPVIVISADNSPKAAAIHADAFLHKPVRANDLLNAVERVLIERGSWTPAEELENVYRLALLGALTASIEHELRNPLACLVTNTQLADETAPQILAVLRGTRTISADPGVHRACDEIEQLMVELGAMVRDARIGGDRIHDILEAMGKMARAHTERRTPVALVPLVDAAVRLVSGQLRRRARLVRDYRDAPLVMGDETRLLQVFLGLLVNVTVPSSPSPLGGREIRVSVLGAEQSAVVELSERVDDNAEPSVNPAAETAFWLQEPRTDKALCLAVCRSIVLSYGGSIEVTTAPDGGQTVRIVLPAHMPTMSR